ncbi:hypothetical protein PMIN01_08680 [Paraphaeosphaeria minitans]|uniref:Uncharacterized protein n=1 Tax=Paraphaeosphaeria minitans TaxID=565426 RepID=A0A9P6KMX7_9PLEO|nr:hypothetical protein PMIN01_08680 [Paraphaeosphaeria minitans]
MSIGLPSVSGATFPRGTAEDHGLNLAANFEDLVDMGRQLKERVGYPQCAVIGLDRLIALQLPTLEDDLIRRISVKLSRDLHIRIGAAEAPRASYTRISQAPRLRLLPLSTGLGVRDSLPSTSRVNFWKVFWFLRAAR